MREIARTAATAVLSAAVTMLCMLAFAREPKVLAQAPRSPLAGWTTYVDVGAPFGQIITFISESGEIWVYKNGELEGHYKIREIGQPIEKLKK
jgi:hypothetical protein